MTTTVMPTLRPIVADEERPLEAEAMIVLVLVLDGEVVDDGVVTEAGWIGDETEAVAEVLGKDVVEDVDVFETALLTINCP
jgi:hypothetical protein